ncbi:DUF397 domain-containing protein [Actinoallomurus soli]
MSQWRKSTYSAQGESHCVEVTTWLNEVDQS